MLIVNFVFYSSYEGYGIISKGYSILNKGSSVFSEVYGVVISE